MARIQLEHCSLGEFERARKQVAQRIRQARAGNAPEGAHVVGGGMKTRIEREHDARIHAKLFAIGAYVMLHHECTTGGKPHPDAGRIGQIANSDEHKFMVQFFGDELIGSATFCLIPRRHWLPVPDWCVDTYEPRAKRTGWRLNDRGTKLFADLGWQRTPATEGKA